ncbi:MAG: hypothetical protein ACPLZG_12110 [Thermoproteota archaeon]
MNSKQRLLNIFRNSNNPSLQKGGDLVTLGTLEASCTHTVATSGGDVGA